MDYELRERVDEPRYEPAKPPASGAWIMVSAVVVVAAIAAYFAFGRSRREVSEGASAPRNAISGADRALGGEAAPIQVPPLDQTDALVRELVRQLTSHPVAAAWLTTDGLIRNFAVVLANVSDGKSPAAHLRPLRPDAGFQVNERNGGVVIDPRAYRRYDGIAAAVASIDPAGAARVYATLRPRIEEAHRDLGSPGSVDRALEAAIIQLLQVPIVPDPVAIRPKGGTGYAYRDPSLESLTGAQKQLLRTGPANVRTIQASLRAIALALGIPADRLPAANLASRPRT